MTLDQLSVLISIHKRAEIDPTSPEVDFLLEEEWITESEDGALETSERANKILNSALALFTSNKIDMQILENYENQIAYEIKHNSEAFIKKHQIKVCLMASPEIMNELCTRYGNVGWKASHENGSITLIWPQKTVKK